MVAPGATWPSDGARGSLPPDPAPPRDALPPAGETPASTGAHRPFQSVGPAPCSVTSPLPSLHTQKALPEPTVSPVPVSFFAEAPRRANTTSLHHSSPCGGGQAVCLGRCGQGCTEQGVQTPVGDPGSIVLDQYPGAELLGRTAVLRVTCAGTSAPAAAVTAPIHLPSLGGDTEVPHLQPHSPPLPPLPPTLSLLFLPSPPRTRAIYTPIKLSEISS